MADEPTAGLRRPNSLRNDCGMVAVATQSLPSLRPPGTRRGSETSMWPRLRAEPLPSHSALDDLPRRSRPTMTTTPTDDTATSWMADGNCRNYPPAVFFPSDGVGVDRARRICATC